MNAVNFSFALAEKEGVRCENSVDWLKGRISSFVLPFNQYVESKACTAHIWENISNCDLYICCDDKFGSNINRERGIGWACPVRATQLNTLSSAHASNDKIKSMGDYLNFGMSVIGTVWILQRGAASATRLYSTCKHAAFICSSMATGIDSPCESSADLALAP